MGSMIQISRRDGATLPAYEALPAGVDRAPGVVVVQEWWGLNQQIKGTADKLASEGYRAVVPDLFRGKLTTNADEARHLMSNMDWDSAVQDLGGAMDHLHQGHPKSAVMGFCMGGALALIATGTYPELAAGAVFYGMPPEGKVDVTAIKVPLILHYAIHDDWCTPQVVGGLEFDLKKGKVNHELYLYEAHHAFMNDARPEVYDAHAAEQAWRRTMAFINQYLHAVE